MTFSPHLGKTPPGTDAVGGRRDPLAARHPAPRRFLEPTPGELEEPRRREESLNGGSNNAKFICLQTMAHPVHRGGSVNDSVAVDAKRILLRYGAPIGVLDSVSEEDRIRFARLIARTNLPEREVKLRKLLEESGYLKR